MTDPHNPPPETLPIWVLTLLCRPAAALGVRLGLSMRELLDVMQLAVYQVVRDERWSQKQAAEHLDVSVRTIAELSRATKDTFGATDDTYELPRRIELLLWAQPLTLGRLTQALRGVEAARVETALGKLEAAGHVIGDGPAHRKRYRVTRDLSMFPKGSLLARLDGLKRFMGGVRQTVGARFFGEQTNDAGALNFDFRVRAADAERLEWYRALLLDAFRALDQTAVAEQTAKGDEAEVEKVSWSMSWVRVPEGEG